MEIRKGTRDDIEALARLRVEMLCEEEARTPAFKEHLHESTASFLERGMAKGTLSVHLAREGVATIAMGCVNFFTLPPNDWCPSGKTAYLGNLYTSPLHRRQGIAAKIVEALLAEAKSRGSERILLNATEAGRPLYEKYGFEASDTAMSLFPFGIRPLG